MADVTLDTLNCFIFSSAHLHQVFFTTYCKRGLPLHSIRLPFFISKNSKNHTCNFKCVCGPHKFTSRSALLYRESWDTLVLLLAVCRCESEPHEASTITFNSHALISIFTAEPAFPEKDSMPPTQELPQLFMAAAQNLIKTFSAIWTLWKLC
jgi:hypothetical protein